MKSIDETDLEILAELDLNARAAASEIARKLDLSSSTVNSRIDYLEKNGVVKGYSAKIDFFRLGCSSHYVHLKLQYANSETQKKIMEYLKDSSYCRWCSYAQGRYDISALFWFRNGDQFLALWDDFKRNFKQFIKEADVVPYYGEVRSGLPFTKGIHNETRHKAVGASEQARIDDTERSILRILGSDGRASYSEIGRSVGLTPAAVKYRLDQLIKKKVIVGFRLLIDMERLGYTQYNVGFDLDSTEDRDRIGQHILDKTSTTSLYRTAGWADIAVGMYTRSSKELFSVLHEINDEFSDNIRDYDIHEFPVEVKKVYMPEF